jgi:hypothetical protein
MPTKLIHLLSFIGKASGLALTIAAPLPGTPIGQTVFDAPRSSRMRSTTSVTSQATVNPTTVSNPETEHRFVGVAILRTERKQRKLDRPMTPYTISLSKV